MSREDELREIALREIAEEELAQEEKQAPPQIDLGQDVQKMKDSALQFQETIMAGAAEAVPGAKQIGSAINATYQTLLGDEGTGEWGEEYEKAMDSVNESVDRAKERDPGTYYATDLGISIGQGIVAGPSVLAQAALGGAHAYSRSRNVGKERWQETLGGTALGGVLTFVGNSAASGVKWVKGKMFDAVDDLAAKTTIASVQPKESTKFVKQANNMAKFRYKGDYSKMANHADEIMNMRSSKNMQQIADNISDSKHRIGGRIYEIIDHMDDATSAVKGKVSTKDGGIIQAELKNAVGGKSRWDRSLPEDLRPDFTEIDDLIDSVTLEVKRNKKLVQNKVVEKVPFTDLGGQGKGVKEITNFVPGEEITEDIVSRQLTPKDLFKIKVKIANRIEKVFNDKLAGRVATTGERALMKKQQSIMVGKLADIIDTEVGESALAVYGDDALVTELRDLNKQYALASFLEEVAYDTVSSTSGSAFQLTRDLTSWKGLAAAGMVGVTNPVAATGILLGQAILKNPGTPVKAAKSLNKLASFLQSQPKHKYAIEIANAITNTSQPEQLQKDLGGFIGGFNLMSNAVARDLESPRMHKNDLSAYIRLREGDKAAEAFNEALEDDASLGAAMDMLSKKPYMKDMIQDGLGWAGKVYTEEDKAMLSDQLMANSDISLAQRIMLRKQLMGDGTIPQTQPDEKPAYKHIPRRKDRHSY